MSDLSQQPEFDALGEAIAAAISEDAIREKRFRGSLAAGFRRPPPITDAQVEAAVDVMLHQGLDGRTWQDYARAVLQAARDAS